MNSKEVLEKTGISRATLNNYISWGIVPKPEVLPPEPHDGAAPRIGYFPDDVIDRITEIQRLKSEGWSMTRISEHFGQPAVGRSTAAVPDAAAQIPSAPAPTFPAPIRDGALPTLSFDEIAHPAYLVNNRFEVVWLNDSARSRAWPNFAPLPRDAVSHGIFKYLVQGQAQAVALSAESRQAILRLHMGLARQRGVGLPDLCREVPPDQVPVVERLHEEAEPFDFPMVVRAPVAASRPGGAGPLFLYALSFHEGVLFLYVPGGADAVESALLTQPEPVRANDPARRVPALTPVAILVTDLQHSARLWSELPAEEYFELINDIWLAADPIFKRHHGTHGKHPAEGLICYFLPRSDSNYLWNALAAAQELREAMRRVSKEWQIRKGWPLELYMNTGIDEGQDWLGALRPGGPMEFTVLGDAVNHATQISDLSRAGAIWVTRNLMGKLAARQRQRLKYGVHRPDREGREVFIPSTFSRVENLVDLAAAGNEKLKAIARLPITQIVEIAAEPGNDPDGTAGRSPA